MTRSTLPLCSTRLWISLKVKPFLVISNQFSLCPALSFLYGLSDCVSPELKARFSTQGSEEDVCLIVEVVQKVFDVSVPPTYDLETLASVASELGVSSKVLEMARDNKEETEEVFPSEESLDEEEIELLSSLSKSAGYKDWEKRYRDFILVGWAVDRLKYDDADEINFGQICNYTSYFVSLPS